MWQELQRLVLVGPVVGITVTNYSSSSTKLNSSIITPHTPLPLNSIVDYQTPLPPRPPPRPQFEHNLLAFAIHTYPSPRPPPPPQFDHILLAFAIHTYPSPLSWTTQSGQIS